MELLEPLFKILLINMILSGDNAFVIAMASKNLPRHLQGKAIRWGAIGAVLLRIIFTILMLSLLKLPFIHLVGGILLLILAYKLLTENENTHQVKSGSTLTEAIGIILFADVIMSLDNVLAIAAVADNSIFLIIFGIVLSFPIILFASEFILKLMQHYSFIIFIGAGVLAWTAGEMIAKEERIHHLLVANGISEMIIMIFMTLLILLLGGVRRTSSNTSG